MLDQQENSFQLTPFIDLSGDITLLTVHVTESEARLINDLREQKRQYYQHGARSAVKLVFSGGDPAKVVEGIAAYFGK